MNETHKIIESILEQRFGKHEAQALRFGRARVLRKDIQFMDIKQMSEIVEIYRSKARQAIVHYRYWNHAHGIETDPITKLYSAAEGAMYRRHISDAVKLWYIVHRDYHWMRKVYLMRCLGPNARVEWQKAA